MVILEEHLETRLIQRLPWLGQSLVGPRGIEGHGDGISRLQSQAVAVGLSPVHLHAARIHKALGLPVADSQNAVKFRSQCNFLGLGLPSLVQACHIHLRARRSSERCATR